MHSFRSIVLCLLVVIAPKAMAQEEEFVFSPDRPGMATGPGVTPFKSVLFEAGVQYDKAGDDHSLTLPTTLVRVGISRFAELRVGFDGALSKSGGSKGWNYSASLVNFGTKLRVFEGYKAIPEVAFMANFAVPCTKSMADKMHVAPSVYALFNNDVTDWLSVGYNVGAEWNGEDATPATFVAVCLGANATDNLGFFVESYNYFIKEKHQSADCDWNLDFSLNYMVTPRLQLDLYSGINLQRPKEGALIGAGVAWKIN